MPKEFKVSCIYDRKDELEEMLNKIKSKFNDFAFNIETSKEVRTVGVYNGKDIMRCYLNYAVTVNVDFLNHNEYVYLATLKKEESGVLVYSFKSEDFTRFYDVNFRCDHCNTNHQRNIVHVFIKDGIEYMIGSTCVKEYFGVHIGSLLCRLFSLYETLGGIDEDRFCGFGGKEQFDSEGYCKYVFGLLLKTKRYISKSKCDEISETPTSEYISRLIGEARFGMENRRQAQEELKEYADLAEKEYDYKKISTYWEEKEAEDPTNNFVHNLNIHMKMIEPAEGFLAYAVFGYMNDVLDLRGKKAAEKLEKEIAKEPVPNTSERIKIVGTIVNISEKENYYTGKLEEKFIVLDDRGFKVWGSEMYDGNHQFDTGERIEFMAKVSISDNDKFFGFYKRPTKAKLLNSTEAQ